MAALFEPEMLFDFRLAHDPALDLDALNRRKQAVIVNLLVNHHNTIACDADSLVPAYGLLHLVLVQAVETHKPAGRTGFAFLHFRINYLVKRRLMLLQPLSQRLVDCGIGTLW